LNVHFQILTKNSKFLENLKNSNNSNTCMQVIYESFIPFQRVVWENGQFKDIQIYIENLKFP
jgi:hypothetical protein